MKNLQNKIKETFERNFGYTPLSERLDDIQKEFFELKRWQDSKNLKEEAGDLLASLIQLHNESGWDVEENIQSTLNKINSRYLQYKSLGRKTKVAILGGAFNPITKGHIQLAQFVLNTSNEFDEVWLLPAYEHMLKQQMISSEHRLKMCELAVKIDGRIKVFDYEIKNKLKGETFNFFKRLKQEKELNEKFNFSMIIGIDNANNFDKWVNYKEVERMVRFVVVPRKGVERDFSVDWYLKPPHIFLNKENNILNISSTKIREWITLLENNPKYLYKIKENVNENVLAYIIEHNLYK